MKLEVKAATIEQKPALKQLMQLYLYDFSEHELANNDVNKKGLFEDKYLDFYWEDPVRFPFVVYVDGKIAGFVLVNSHTYVQKPGEAKSIAEFFIMRKYQRKGIGKTVAFEIFNKFPGKWEVQQTKTNEPAQKFWQSVLQEYTQGDFKETFEDKDWHGPIQTFDNSNRV